jgi:hypothetical protein
VLELPEEEGEANEAVTVLDPGGLFLLQIFEDWKELCF